ncbi:MAG: hypothetical protein K6A36_07560 [Paludibacteraceae bacterium]|nr:hypothetical protein [Paludibacteraceae bacterium]
MNKTIILQPESCMQYDWKAIAARPNANHQPQMDLVAYKALYINKIAQARACSQEPVLVSLPIIDANRYFAHITRGMTSQERMNVLCWLGGSTDRLRDIHDLYNLTLFRLAAQQCVHIVDVTSPMLTNRNEELLQADGVSLSETGATLVDAEINKVRVQEIA